MFIIKNIPNDIKSINQGKGNPVEYILMPIEKIRNLYGIEIKINNILFQINNGLINKIQQTF